MQSICDTYWGANVGLNGGNTAYVTAKAFGRRSPDGELVLSSRYPTSTYLQRVAAACSTVQGPNGRVASDLLASPGGCRYPLYRELAVSRYKKEGTGEGQGKRQTDPGKSHAS